jgi:hypothetical protein
MPTFSRQPEAQLKDFLLRQTGNVLDGRRNRPVVILLPHLTCVHRESFLEQEKRIMLRKEEVKNVEHQRYAIKKTNTNFTFLLPLTSPTVSFCLGKRACSTTA